MNWLIAEDEADIRNLVAMMCQVWGHETVTFENGQLVWDWLDKVEKNEPSITIPDLVLMDIRMPGKKGNELAHRMRRMPQLSHLPIVLMTAFSLSDGERAEMMTVDGVDYIITKPLPDFEELRVLLHRIHDQRQNSASA